MIVRKIVIRFCNNIRLFSNEINKRGGGIFLWRVESFKIGKHDVTFIREMRVMNNSITFDSFPSFMGTKYS